MARSNRNLTDIFQDTANAIRGKTGLSEPINPRDFADEIEGIPTGSSEIVPGPNDNVIVYDYDGTVLDAKQVAVGQEYTLPEGPTHNGLTFEEWTATSPISNGKITIPATKQVRIGATYHTTNGHIEIDVHAPKNIPITLASGWTNVDWGDGTVTTGSSTHAYAAEGDYTIKVLSNVTSISSGWINLREIIKSLRLPNSIITLGDNFLGSAAILTKIVIPNSVTSIGEFSINASKLSAIVIPSSVTSIGQRALQGCFVLTKIVIPNSVTSISNYILNNGYALQSFVIPSNVTILGNGAFNNFRSISSIIIPSTVTSIGIQTFQNFLSCGVFDFSNLQSVPTIQSDTFGNINANAKIIVPDALYNDWISASNWANLASQIVKASEA